MPTRKRRPTRPIASSSHTYWFGISLIVLGVLIVTFFSVVVFPFPFGLRGHESFMSSSRRQQQHCEQSQQGVWEVGHCFPKTETACRQQGGVWGFLGTATGYGCNLVASDGGQACQDGTACTSGKCLAVIDASVREQLASGQVGSAKGFCAGLLRVRGCNAYLTQGRAGSMVCEP